MMKKISKKAKITWLTASLIICFTTIVLLKISFSDDTDNDGKYSSNVVSSETTEISSADKDESALNTTNKKSTVSKKSVTTAVTKRLHISEMTTAHSETSNTASPKSTSEASLPQSETQLLQVETQPAPPPVETPAPPPETQPPVPVEPPAPPPETQPPIPVEPPAPPPETQPPAPPETQPSALPTPNKLAEYQSEVLRLVNEQRRAAGVGELSGNDSLNQAAQVRAAEIVQSFSHTRPDGQSCFTVFGQFGISAMTMGENIAAGSSDPSGVMNQWMNSVHHKENILNSAYSSMGIGFVETQDDYRYYWVQIFMG